jgi:hypothetical protein
MMVAGRYRSQQQLIGPMFFPLYLFVLKAGLGIALLVTIVLAAVTAALHGDAVRHTVDAMLAFPRRGLMVFAWTTLAFAGLDIAQASLRLVKDWDPRSLPKLVRHDYQIPRARTLCDLFFVLAGAVWLLLLPGAPFLILGPAAALVEFAPIWRLAYVPMVVLTFATAAVHIVDFVRPYWTRPRALIRLTISAAWLVMFTLLSRADELFLPRFTGSRVPEGVHLDRVVEIVNVSFQIGFVVAAVITVVEIVRTLRRLKQRRGTPLSSDSATARAGR